MGFLDNFTDFENVLIDAIDCLIEKKEFAILVSKRKIKDRLQELGWVIEEANVPNQWYCRPQVKNEQSLPSSRRK